MRFLLISAVVALLLTTRGVVVAQVVRAPLMDGASFVGVSMLWGSDGTSVVREATSIIDVDIASSAGGSNNQIVTLSPAAAFPIPTRLQVNNAATGDVTLHLLTANGRIRFSLRGLLDVSSNGMQAVLHIGSADAPPPVFGAPCAKCELFNVTRMRFPRFVADTLPNGTVIGKVINETSRPFQDRTWFGSLGVRSAASLNGGQAGAFVDFGEKDSIHNVVSPYWDNAVGIRYLVSENNQIFLQIMGGVRAVNGGLFRIAKGSLTPATSQTPLRILSGPFTAGLASSVPALSAPSCSAASPQAAACFEMILSQQTYSQDIGDPDIDGSLWVGESQPGNVLTSWLFWPKQNSSDALRSLSAQAFTVAASYALDGNKNMALIFEKDAAHPSTQLQFARYDASSLLTVAIAPSGAASAPSSVVCPDCTTLRMARQDNLADPLLSGVWVGKSNRNTQHRFEFTLGPQPGLGSVLVDADKKARFFSTRAAMSELNIHRNDAPQFGYIELSSYRITDGVLELLSRLPGSPNRPLLSTDSSEGTCDPETCMRFVLCPPDADSCVDPTASSAGAVEALPLLTLGALAGLFLSSL